MSSAIWANKTEKALAARAGVSAKTFLDARLSETARMIEEATAYLEGGAPMPPWLSSGGLVSADEPGEKTRALAVDALASLRQEAERLAGKLLPFHAHQLKAIEVSGKDGGAIDAKVEVVFRKPDADR